MNVQSLRTSGVVLNLILIKNARKAWMVVHVLSAKTVYQPFQMASVIDGLIHQVGIRVPLMVA